MTLDEIQSLPISNLGKEDSTLWLWTIQKFLPVSFDIMREWGYRYQRTITWDKMNGMCLFGFHHRTEFLLFGYRGHIDMYPKRRTFPTLVSARSPRHSEKPDEFRQLIEPFGKERIELFARQTADGWDSWGNEV